MCNCSIGALSPSCERKKKQNNLNIEIVPVAFPHCVRQSTTNNHSHGINILFYINSVFHCSGLTICRCRWCWCCSVLLKWMKNARKWTIVEAQNQRRILINRATMIVSFWRVLMHTHLSSDEWIWTKYFAQRKILLIQLGCVCVCVCFGFNRRCILSVEGVNKERCPAVLNYLMRKLYYLSNKMRSTILLSNTFMNILFLILISYSVMLSCRCTLSLGNYVHWMFHRWWQKQQQNRRELILVRTFAIAQVAPSIEIPFSMFRACLYAE